MLLMTCAAASFLFQDILNPIEQFPGNERFMYSAILFACPHELAVIDRISEDFVQNTLGYLFAAPPEGNALIVRFPGQFQQRIIAGGIPFKNLPDLLAHSVVWLDEPLSVALHVDVPEGCK